MLIIISFQFPHQFRQQFIIDMWQSSDEHETRIEIRLIHPGGRFCKAVRSQEIKVFCPCMQHVKDLRPYHRVITVDENELFMQAEHGDHEVELFTVFTIEATWMRASACDRFEFDAFADTTIRTSNIVCVDM